MHFEDKVEPMPCSPLCVSVHKSSPPFFVVFIFLWRCQYAAASCSINIKMHQLASTSAVLHITSSARASQRRTRFRFHISAFLTSASSLDQFQCRISLHILRVVFRGAEHKKSYVNFIRYIPYFSVSFSPHTSHRACSSLVRALLGENFAVPHLSACVSVWVCADGRHLHHIMPATLVTFHNLHPEQQIYSRSVFNSFSRDFYYTYIAPENVRLVYSGIVSAYRTAGQNANVHRDQIHLEAHSLSCATDNTFRALDQIS